MMSDANSNTSDGARVAILYNKHSESRQTKQ